MKLYNIIIAAIIIFGAFSCTDLSDEIYDTIPVDKYPENATQANRIATPAFLKIKELTTSGGGWWFAQEISGDGVVCPTRAKDWDNGGKYRVLHTHTWSASTPAIKGIWKQLFQGVVLCNQAIESIEISADKPEIAEVIAQLKVMRAYYYYLLLDSYGDVPYVTSFKDAVKTPQRNPRAEVFNNIVSEVLASIELLPDPTAASSINKGTAYALLAKLYLNAEVYSGSAQWENANEMCDKIIALGKYGLETDIKAPFVEENGGSIENIYTIPYDEDNLKGFSLHMRTLHYSSDKTFNMSSQPWNGFALVKDHFDTYTEEDKRNVWFLHGPQKAFDGSDLGFSIDPFIPVLFMDNSYTEQEIKNTGVRVIKYSIAPGTGKNMNNDYVVFRYADVLLMKAEALIRMGQSGDEYLNMIRNRAGLVSLTNANLEDVLLERAKEMVWEGVRRQDLIRFGKYNDAWWEKEESPAYRNLFPVPQEQINSNENLLPQNTGY